MKSFTLLFSVLFLLSPFAFAQDNPAEIMEKVDRQQRDANDSTFSKSRLSTCKFSIKEKKPICIEQPRKKVIETVQKQYGAEKKDGKSISIVLEPASEKGIGMLTYSYDDEDKDTESWLYLSALGKVKRMVSGGKEEQEPVAFFGSEFTTEDMENGKTDEYSYKIVKEGKYGKSQVWVIEAIPSEKRLKKTRYSKSLTWIDKEKLVVLKTQTYDKRGAVWKKIYSKNFVQTRGIWKALETTVMNVKDNRMSTIFTDEIAVDAPIKEEFLTQRPLTDFAFRESNLGKLRKGSVKTQ
jgi:outer membrane lipoprotein-sorting protein